MYKFEVRLSLFVTLLHLSRATMMKDEIFFHESRAYLNKLFHKLITNEAKTIVRSASNVIISYYDTKKKASKISHLHPKVIHSIFSYKIEMLPVGW